MRYTGATIFVATCLMAGTALAQTTTPPDAQQRQRRQTLRQRPRRRPADQAAPAAAPAAPAPPSAYHQAGMDFSFLLDGYVDGNANDPASGWNGLRNFDYRADTVHFNMGKITIDRAPGPIGFHLDVGFGEIFSATHVTDAAPEAMKYFEQAYVDFKPKSWKGVEVDVGEFRHVGGRRGDRRQRGTGTIPARCCLRGRFRITTSASALRSQLARISPAACNW